MFKTSLIRQLSSETVKNFLSIDYLKAENHIKKINVRLLYIEVGTGTRKNRKDFETMAGRYYYRL
jgi:hypothetical protein